VDEPAVEPEHFGLERGVDEVTEADMLRNRPIAMRLKLLAELARSRGAGA
jgi:hypothetical protein